MPPRKRTASAAENAAEAEPVAKRRSSRQAAAATAVAEKEIEQPKPSKKQQTKPKAAQEVKKSAEKTKKEAKVVKNEPKEVKNEPKDIDQEPLPTPPKKPAARAQAKDAKKKQTSPKNNKAKDQDAKKANENERAASEDPDVDDIPTVNPEAPRHDGEWYWLMKAEPETRYENGIDVRFSIDDLRARKKPEGWDGIRNWAARNHMRNMNAGDKAFFYHSNCKEPGIAGIMEIVKEFSEDTTARRPGTPYYDPKSTKDNPRWSLVHVEFRKKFAVPIGLKELRELGDKGGPLENMQMLKQSRLSVSRVGESEWRALCELADRKAKEAGLEHEEGRL